MTVRVVTDSTAGLPPEVAAAARSVGRLGPALGVHGGPGIISMVVIEAEKADGDPGSANGGTD